MTGWHTLTTELDRIAELLIEQIANERTRDWNALTRRHGMSLIASAWLDNAGARYISPGLMYVADNFRGCVDMRTTGTPCLDTVMLMERTRADVKRWIADHLVNLERKLLRAKDIHVEVVSDPDDEFGGAPGDIAITARIGKQDRALLIRQRIVKRRSPKGRIFLQFPARIWVDGVFLSEAAFDMLLGAEGTEEKEACRV